MPNKFGDAVRDTVAKARSTKNKYLQAAKDLAAAPGAVKKVVGPGKAAEVSTDPFEAAGNLSRERARKKR